MKKLFDIKNESLSNEPTDEEIQFIKVYIENQFTEIEHTDIGTKKNEERQALSATVNSIKHAIADLLSPDGGNYHKLLIRLNQEINFESRLSNIIEKINKQFFVKNKNEAGISSSSNNKVHNTNYGYETYELNEYLNKLQMIPPLPDEEIELHLKSHAEQLKPFQHLSEYLKHLAAKYSTGQLGIDNQHKYFPIVFFLRDTLLLYLGAKRLQAKCVSIDVRTVLINRKLIHSFIPSEEINSIYKKSYNLIYQLLRTYKGKFSIEFIEQYNELFRNNMTEPEIQLLRFTCKYLEAILGNENKFIGVDTAAHGTMPLIAHVATGRLHSLELFTSTPWLGEFYSSNIFANHFPEMRTLEALACQEQLFEFAYISKGKIYINETCDPSILAKSKFEIGLFLNIVDKSIPLS